MPYPPVVTRQSNIHGTGVFSTHAILAGERIIEYRGIRIPKTQSHLRPETITQGSPDQPVFTFTLDPLHNLDGDIPDNPAKFINHSCEENCEAIHENNQLWIFAKKDIPAETELTIDYAFSLESFFEHPCHCHTPNCTGYIVASPLRHLIRKMLSQSKFKPESRFKKYKILACMERSEIRREPITQQPV
ncbi:MAG: SET domain-containing protein-lysine N-methyltransferase [Puniceicoccales bacterium]|jgi:SET domain-containing protein|nr:SET domain-containing protein-lysine N-methyltransferase [Puniceicoccales bacterium]